MVTSKPQSDSQRIQASSPLRRVPKTVFVCRCPPLMEESTLLLTPNQKYLAIVVDFFIDSQVRQEDIGVIESHFE